MAENVLASKLARDYAVEVRPLNGAQEFVRVRGINNLTPGFEPNFEDTTDYDNDGWTSQEKTMQGWSLQLGMISKMDTESNALDKGQQVLQDAHDKFGSDSMIECRWYERDGGDEAYEGVATVQWEPQGGSATDLRTVNVTLQGNGGRRHIDNPAKNTGQTGEMGEQ
ncbi:hypothetical protein QDX21_03495 [Auritidibacter ignavus]|uniref:Phage tail protein n=1 Tax=Auritidibacter ignavus TaxID=678932 RepID=A0AAJ6AI40_9MICC|nr:hypothetical protein [Auritidibacter ignavus]WGH93876.1 hypothetical protein QDX21_03495 [Auritidibacter ignavus]